MPTGGADGVDVGAAAMDIAEGIDCTPGSARRSLECSSLNQGRRSPAAIWSRATIKSNDTGARRSIICSVGAS